MFILQAWKTEDYSASLRDITTRKHFPRYGPYGIRKTLDIERLEGEGRLQSESSVEIMRSYHPLTFDLGDYDQGRHLAT